MRKVNIISLVFFLALALGASAEQLTVSPKELHVRSGPGVEFNVTNKLLRGAIVTQIDSKEIKPGVTWIKIDYGSGIGWINRKYVAASNVSNIAGVK